MGRLFARHGILVLVMAAMLVLVACGGGTTGDPGAPSAPGASGSQEQGAGESPSGSETVEETIEAIEAAAKAEGELMWYTSGPEGPSLKVLAAFKEDYPEIEVKLHRQAVVDLAQRFFAENQARQNVADFVSFSDFGIVQAGIDAGLFEQWLPPNLSEGFDSQFIDPNGYYYLNRLVITTIAVNTDLVPEDRIPTSYADLLDPWWQGKVGILDARTNGGGYLGYWGISQAMGREYWKELYDNGARIFEQGGQIKNALAAGEIAAKIAFDYHAWDLVLDGAPVQVIFPEEGVGWSSDQNLIAANAPHKNAAKLFSWWLATEKGSEIYARETRALMARRGTPPVPGPEVGRLPIEDLKLLTDLRVAEEEKEDFRAYLDQVWR